MRTSQDEGVASIEVVLIFAPFMAIVMAAIGLVYSHVESTILSNAAASGARVAAGEQSSLGDGIKHTRNSLASCDECQVTGRIGAAGDIQIIVSKPRPPIFSLLVGPLVVKSTAQKEALT